jgi:hypothetical protein
MKYFNAANLDDGNDLAILPSYEQRRNSRDLWRDGVAAIATKEHQLWTKRNKKQSKEGKPSDQKPKR